MVQWLQSSRPAESRLVNRLLGQCRLLKGPWLSGSCCLLRSRSWKRVVKHARVECVDGVHDASAISLWLVIARATVASFSVQQHRPAGKYFTTISPVHPVNNTSTTATSWAPTTAGSGSWSRTSFSRWEASAWYVVARPPAAPLPSRPALTAAAHLRLLLHLPTHLPPGPRGGRQGRSEAEGSCGHQQVTVHLLQPRPRR